MKNNVIQKLPPQPIAIRPTKKSGNDRIPSKQAFSHQLKQAEALAISKHAGIRMQQRQIKIQPHVWKEIGAKVDEAKQKGVNDSLVLLQNAALIVSAKNSTVVTVMDRQEAGSQIFTKIDGTIIIDE